MSPKLVAKFDLREYDWNTGTRIPLPYDQQAECERCERRHCIVYVVQIDDKGEDVRRVGSGCCRGLVNGWEPSREETRAVDRAMAQREDEERLRLVREWTEKVLQELPFVSMPPIRQLMGPNLRGVEVWGWSPDQVPADMASSPFMLTRTIHPNIHDLSVPEEKRLLVRDFQERWARLLVCGRIPKSVAVPQKLRNDVISHVEFKLLRRIRAEANSAQEVTS